MNAPGPLVVTASHLQIELVDHLLDGLAMLSDGYAGGIKFERRDDINDEVIYECEDGRRQFRVDVDVRVTQIGGAS